MLDRSLTILHLSDLQYGNNHPFGIGDAATANSGSLFTKMADDLKSLVVDAGGRVDCIVVSGDLTERGTPSEFAQAFAFLNQLCGVLGVESSKVVLIPGNHDVNRKDCEAYFAKCDADEIEPAQPYWQKWHHYAQAFRRFYESTHSVAFTKETPWSLYEWPDLKVVVSPRPGARSRQ